VTAVLIALADVGPSVQLEEQLLSCRDEGIFRNVARFVLHSPSRQLHRRLLLLGVCQGVERLQQPLYGFSHVIASRRLRR